MKIRIGDFKRIVRKALFEGNDVDEQDTEDSLDAQIDRFLAQYVGEAKLSKHEGLDFRMLTRRIMTEDNESADTDKDDVGEQTKLTQDDIDIESFANSVVRLIENYDNLLEVRNTLLRRARGFLNKDYERDVVDSFEDVMRETHGISDGMSKSDIDAEEFPAPPADRAGGDGGGGGGGI